MQAAGQGRKQERGFARIASPFLLLGPRTICFAISPTQAPTSANTPSFSAPFYARSCQVKTQAPSLSENQAQSKADTRSAASLMPQERTQHTENQLPQPTLTSRTSPSPTRRQCSRSVAEPRTSLARCALVSCTSLPLRLSCASLRQMVGESRQRIGQEPAADGEGGGGNLCWVIKEASRNVLSLSLLGCPTATTFCEGDSLVGRFLLRSHGK